MKYIDRNGKIKGSEGLQDRFLKTLYENLFGRLLLKPLVLPPVSRLGGLFLSSPLSRFLIAPFVRINQIDLSFCEKNSFASYNDFFTRKLKDGARKIDMAQEAFISPCDGKLSIYPIQEDSRFYIKYTPYTVEELLRDKKLAKQYRGGYAWIFRLSVEDYHRYCYVADGHHTAHRRIPGIFHTVNPVANDVYPIYKENTREYSLLRTKEFGTVLMMEVGALLVGRIENHHGKQDVKKGQEKGNFAFGGSTVILLTQKGKVNAKDVFLSNTAHGYETAVQMGERVGTSVKG